MQLAGSSQSHFHVVAKKKIYIFFTERIDICMCIGQLLIDKPKHPMNKFKFPLTFHILNFNGNKNLYFSCKQDMLKNP